MDKIIKNNKGLELITRLFELQNMFTKIHFLVCPFDSGDWTKQQNIEYLKNERNFEEIKIIFHLVKHKKRRHKL